MPRGKKKGATDQTRKWFHWSRSGARDRGLSCERGFFSGMAREEGVVEV